VWEAGSYEVSLGMFRESMETYIKMIPPRLRRKLPSFLDEIPEL